MNLSGYPYTDIRFDREGRVVDRKEVAAALALAGSGITDLVVLSHGWNNDIAEAREGYTELVASMRAVHDRVPGLAGRSIGLVGVLWPSKKFAEHDLIPGGAASLGVGADADAVRAQLAELCELWPDALAQAAGLVDRLPDSPEAQRRFVELVRSALPPDAAEEQDATDQLLTLDGAELLRRLSVPVAVPPPGGLGAAGDPRGSAAGRAWAGPGTAPGGAAGLLAPPGIFGAARNLLNLVTYYEMKARAGTVGQRGLAPLLGQVLGRAATPRVHLAGHSFGARLVTAAATQRPARPLGTLTLLQAAFSHYGFADDWEPGKDGLFRGLVTGRHVAGPVLITHTANDKAVGIAYALASRIAGQVAAAVGDAGDKYGALGRNGAQKTPEARFGRLQEVGAAYSWQPGRLHNLLADAYIRSHSDYKGRQVAYALLHAVAST
ncbi:hypothetical protein TH66_20525 [Carbonactinospora thermoautotrophica]|uniref:Serine-threonine protein kinase n=2 Tax=Carbonactinospora thermoautotrophica TaxID=1469144 RepID=A0A132MJ07_9ACTN|nr:hypothetical protein [Carbonactinospora thermoautotrophica]KWW97824.1 hypothetical protein TH66_20525 [Carbonactinospora thermoautotrophica]KWW98443.1 hypothetical protein LI90_63 [Carbonactinospora thermoautotrophica]